MYRVPTLPWNSTLIHPHTHLHALAPSPFSGRTVNGVYQSGLFDKGSWMESQAGWARTVVTGRARLAGMPCGVVAVETQMVTRSIPADPGMPDSSEQNIVQAGQVRAAAAAATPLHAVPARWSTHPASLIHAL